MTWRFFNEDISETLYDLKTIYSQYAESRNETEFNILQLYPKEECFKEKDGIYQYRHFHLIGFNTNEKTWSDLGLHDNILTDILSSNKNDLYQIAIMADGSTFVGFTRPIEIISFTQTVYI